ncbi:hypothetical protein [Azospirillum doebereinerae]
MLPPLIISHIPKTGGTSLGNLVRELSPDVSLVYEGQLQLGNPNLDFILNFRATLLPSVVMGHFSHGIHRLLGIPPRYVTVLREPLKRIVSLYRHQQRLENSSFAEILRSGATLRDFVASGITEMTNNHMCRVIAGIAPETGKINEDWLLGLALHNLKHHYVAVGVQEDLPAVTARIGNMLNWPAYVIPTDNMSNNPEPEIDPATHAVLVADNALDMQLYDHVRKHTASYLDC